MPDQFVSRLKQRKTQPFLTPEKIKEQAIRQRRFWEYLIRDEEDY